MPRVMTAGGQKLLDELPLFLRVNHQYRAWCNALAEQIGILEAETTRLEAEAIPSTASAMLGLWESIVDISVPDGTTVAQRRAALIAFISIMSSDGSGSSWVANLDKILNTTWTYEVHDPAVPTSPPANYINVKVPYATGSFEAEILRDFLQRITAATVVLNAFYSQGFILDESLLDEHPLN